MLKQFKLALISVGAYIYMIMPERRRRAEIIKGNLYAHRGLHNKKIGIPENTKAAFRRAVKAGYGIELDVQLTKDQKVVVFHDFSLKRVCGVPGDVSDYTYEELRSFPVLQTKEHIPLFEEVLEIVDGQVPLLVEYKYKNFGSRVCHFADEILQKYQGDYVIESFHPWALLWYRLHRPDICRGQLAMNYQRQEGTYTPVHLLSRHLMMDFIGRPDFIAYDIRDGKAVSKTLCRKMFKSPCAGWTIKNRRQLERLKNGFDAYIFEGFMP